MRQVVGKAEHQDKGTNPRFVVASIRRGQMDAQTLYEQPYRGLADMANDIKEEQLWLFADRTGTGRMRANQLWLYFSSVAHADAGVAPVGIAGHTDGSGTVQHDSLRLLKVGAQLKITVRRVWVSLAAVTRSLKSPVRSSKP